MNDIPDITLNNGVTIPQLGFGTFQIDPSDTAAAVHAALDIGYRHIDTAQMYRNEAEVAEGVRRSGLDRDEVFLTSKLDNESHDPDDAIAAFDRTLERMELDHLDLFLIHWPLPQVGDFVATWRALEQIADSGRSRAIGVSNFEPHHLERLTSAGLTVPAVNQVECHPYLPQDALRTVDRDLGIVTEAWSPIAQGKVLDDERIVDVAQRVDRTPAQVTLRWHLQRGDVVFPKSGHRERMEENFAVTDFELSDADMSAIGAMGRDDGRLGPHPDEMN